MRKLCLWAIAAALLYSLPVGLAWAQEHGGQSGHDNKRPPGQRAPESDNKLPVCPVMGETIDFNVKTMTTEGPVYFCCDMCISKFKQEQTKYAEKLATQRRVLAKLDRIQVNCPVDGKSVDGKLTAEVGGHRIAFCSKECEAKYSEHPGEFKAKLADSYTYQTRCPVTGERIQPAVFSDLATGERIYFCCPKCSERLLKEPAKYVPKLAEQGVNIDPEKVKPAEKPKKEDKRP